MSETNTGTGTPASGNAVYALAAAVLLFFATCLTVGMATLDRSHDTPRKTTVEARHLDLADGNIVVTQISPAVLALVDPTAKAGYFLLGPDTVPRGDLAMSPSTRRREADLACIVGPTGAIQGVMIYLDVNAGVRFVNSTAAPDGWEAVCDGAAALADSQTADG